MNSLAKLLASISALIASLSFAWIALTITGMIPNYAARVTVYHKGDIGVELHSGFGDFEITHSGSVQIIR
jgi:hypothetical protein